MRAVNYDRLIRRLAEMPLEQKAIRNRLVEQGVGVREATRRAIQATRPPRAVSQAQLAEAVAAAVARREDARRARKAAKKRAAKEAAVRAQVARAAAGQLRAAQLFSEASITATLQEASRDDLAFTAVAAMGGRQPGPGRPVIEVDVQPGALNLEDLPVAATAGMAGSSPFWAAPGAARKPSPFWAAWQTAGTG